MMGLRCMFLVVLATLGFVQAEPLKNDVVKRAASQIDRLLSADLLSDKRLPEARVDDGVFVRRAYLSIIGRIPSADEARAFLDDSSMSKRADLVDRLVASPGFDSHMFNWAADLLRVQSRQGQEKHGLGWHVWLRKSLAQDKPWDEMVKEMLGASGHAVTDPAVGYYLRDRNMQLDNFSNTMQVFLGQQMGCAQCHDHPFDDLTQREYYQMASFGGGIEYRSEDLQKMVKKVATDLYQENAAKTPIVADQGQAKQRKGKHNENQVKQRFMREAGQQLRPFFRQLSRDAIADNPRSLLRLPKDYKYSDGKPGDEIAPATLFGPKLEDVDPADRKQAFASWVASPENPYFTKTIVNRLWDRTFGAPLYESLDDLKGDSRTFHPKLAEVLQEYMKLCHYDMRQFSRILFRTQLFERACMAKEPEMGEPMAFTGMVLQRMSAEQLYDSFVVLRNGEVDDAPSAELEKSWDDYVRTVSTVFQAETRDLLVLAESARQGEARLREAQESIRVARRMMTDAKTRESRIDAQVAMNKARQQMSAARDDSNPLMMQMSATRERDKHAKRRASDLPAPFNPGTLVREFGGSDRETPSSSRAEATVPQALALLNSWQTHPLAGGKNGHLAQALLDLPSPEQRLEYLFLTLFGSRPNPQDTQRYVSHAGNQTTLTDLATAMLNSNRFLFIQ